MGAIVLAPFGLQMSITCPKAVAVVGIEAQARKWFVPLKERPRNLTFLSGLGRFDIRQRGCETSGGEPPARTMAVGTEREEQ